jgi:hypothetical protein
VRKGLVSSLAVAGGIALGMGAAGCRKKAPETKVAAPAPPPKPARPPIPKRAPLPALAAGETYRFDKGVAKKVTIAEARAAGLLDVDLSDGWAPFIFQDSGGGDPKVDPPKPNAYRETFVALANEKLNEENLPARPGEHNYLEVFGIPPTLSVLAPRFEEAFSPAREACVDGVDREGIETFDGNISFLDRDRSKREYLEALRDADWIRKETEARAQGRDGGAPPEHPPTKDEVVAALRVDPTVKPKGRADRYLKGQARLRAVRALQARLICEGLLGPHTDRSRYVDGQYDLPTHEALAAWERRNDIFGWGFLGGETQEALLQSTRLLELDTFKRVLAERVAAAAGIVEDGSVNQWRKKNPPSYKDADGKPHVVTDLVGEHVSALLAAVGVATPEEMLAFVRANTGGFGTLHVAFTPPPLPPYYADPMALSVEIDRGDIWYDLPFDGRGKPVVQRRDKYPSLTLFVTWRKQKIPLARWRTTIGSWRSEMHADGHVYFKYKNSDVGPRVWKNIVAAPVWVPPDSTPAKDLLTRKVLDRNVGPVTVVNTDVMGPGYQSAYGLVLAIHIDPRRGGFDNQIRTHGSVDYTSIARRFSHGCHRLVNNRAVRLFDFVLRHRKFQRLGNQVMSLKKRFEVDGERYRYELTTRGYYYELDEPVPVNVLEGRVMGAVKAPIASYVRKPGVDYSDVVDATSGDATASTSTKPATPTGDLPPETTPELGP